MRIKLKPSEKDLKQYNVSDHNKANKLYLK